MQPVSALLLVSLLLVAAQAWELHLAPSASRLATKKSGDDVAITCSVEGLELGEDEQSPEITWRRNGEAIQTSGRPYVVRQSDMKLIMYIMKAQKDKDNGDYVCRVTHLGITNRKTITLELNDALAFAEAPETQHPTEGDTGRILCRVTEVNPKPDIAWFRDDKLIKADGRLNFEEDNQVLTIDNFNRATDDGLYRCQPMQTNTGTFLVQQITVEGYVPPSFTLLLPAAGVEGLERRDLQLNCEAIGVPKPTFKWFKGRPEGGAAILATDDKYDVSTNGQLVVRALTAEDEGEYSCQASNDLGNDFSATNVNVFLRPRITRVKNLTKSVDESAEFECAYSGDGEISVNWMFGREALDGLNTEKKLPRISIETEDGVSRLIVDELTLEDANEYQCQAENKAGADMISVFLSITRPPMMLTPAENTLRKPSGKQAIMECEVEATPKPTWTWFFNGNSISPDGGKYFVQFEKEDRMTRLVVKTESSGDFGDYSCEAENGLGEPALATYTVVEIVLPPVPDSVVLKGVHPNFAWASIGNFDADDETITENNRPSEIIFEFTSSVDSVHLLPNFTNAEKVRLTYNATNKYQISGLTPVTKYFIRASASNEAGDSDPSSHQPYTTSDPLPPFNPIADYPPKEGSCALNCEIRWQTPNDRGSTILKYSIEYEPINNVDQRELAESTGETMSIDDVDPAAKSWVLEGLSPLTSYRLRLYAHNDKGQSEPTLILFTTTEKSSALSADSAGGMSALAVLLLVVVVLLLLLIVIDVACYLLNQCGVLMFVCVNFCGRAHPDAVKEMEEGNVGAASLDEKKPLTQESAETVVVTNGNGSEHTASKATTV